MKIQKLQNSCLAVPAGRRVSGTVMRQVFLEGNKVLKGLERLA